MTNKQFWRLVRRTVKKKGLLSAIKDTQGKLATDRARIEEIVLEELAKIFSGKDRQYLPTEVNSSSKRWM